jgi:hypothetical protein
MLVATPALAVIVSEDLVISSEIYVYLSDPGETLAISAATVDQIEVTASTVAITMTASGDPITISSPSRYRLSITSGITDPGTTCGSGSSSLVIPSQASQTTVVIDPSTTCPSGGGGGGGGGGYVPPTTTTVPTTTTGTVTATTAGGTTSIVSSGVTASVSLPANAVSANTTVDIVPTAKTATTVSTAVAAIPLTVNMVGGNVYSYSASSGGVSVSTFSQPVTITISYTDAQIAGLDLTSLKVYYYNSVTNQWVALSSIVNTTNKTVTASTTHFTYFAVFGTPTATTTTTTTTTPISQMTQAEIKAEIIRISNLILQLQAELLKMIGTTEGCNIVSFDRNLQLNMIGDDVKCLQVLLNSSADTQVASSGAGSSGQETTKFGALTKAAVIKFQNKYASEVLTPWGLTEGNGFVGSKTIIKLNELLAK